jgi:C-terminal duplication domain of Friend of PRMT1
MAGYEGRRNAPGGGKGGPKGKGNGRRGAGKGNNNKKPGNPKPEDLDKAMDSCKSFFIY